MVDDMSLEEQMDIFQTMEDLIFKRFPSLYFIPFEEDSI